MKIAVLIKQVPETDNLIIDEESGTVKRTGMESIINPPDLYALESALKIKDKFPLSIIYAVTMGPAGAEKALKEAMAMGIDKAVLVSDKIFAGSDTFATSYILSKAVKKIDSFDLILCGEKAVDGDTGQVGAELAAFLNLNIVSFVSDMDFDGKTFILERITEYGRETIKIIPPVITAVTKAIGEPRLPTLEGKKKASDSNIINMNSDSLNINADYVGIKGSPTRVIKINRPSLKRNPVILKPSSEEEMRGAAKEFIKYLAKKNLL